MELAVAASILVIGTVSVLSATAQVRSLRQGQRVAELAQDALRSVAERMHAASRDSSSDPATWARDLLATFGPGGSQGARFGVAGLTPAAGAEALGTIQIVTDERRTDAELGVELGLPRDLDGDGDALDADVAGRARLLPVVLTVRWRSASGARTLRHAFYLLGPLR